MKAFSSLFGSLLGLWLLSGAQASAAGPSSSAIVPVSFERQTLAVTVQDLSTPPSATPRGWVTSFGVSESGATSPKGIDCGPECFATFDAGTVVTLWAIPFAGSVFEGWTGACSGGSICVVTMDRAQSVTARFDVPSGPTDIKSTFTVSRDGSGNGKVTSGPPGINCGSDCGTRYPSNVNVTLTATAAEGSHVAGWNGPCAGVGTASTCVVTVGPATGVTVTFDVDRNTTPAPAPVPPAPPEPIQPSEPAVPAPTTITVGPSKLRVIRSARRAIQLELTLRTEAACRMRLLRRGSTILTRQVKAQAGRNVLNLAAPRRLPKGHYRLEVVLTDGAGRLQRLSWPVRL